MNRKTGGPGWAFIPENDDLPARTENPRSPRPAVRLEKRSGKKVTVISGLHTYGSRKLEAIARELKAALGAGGTVKNGAIEIQGDKIAPVEAWFRKQADKSGMER